MTSELPAPSHGSPRSVIDIKNPRYVSVVNRIYVDFKLACGHTETRTDRSVGRKWILCFSCDQERSE